MSDSTHAILAITAKSLQKFVLGSDKLREMVGATQLIEDFCSSDLTEKILSSLNITVAQYEIITCAAGQTTIHFKDIKQAKIAASYWPWMAHQLAPGLEVHIAIQPMPDHPGGYIQAIELIQQDLAESRNAHQYQTLPHASPPAMLAPRSGKLAITRHTFATESKVVDSEAFIKNKRREQIRINKGHNPVFESFDFDPDAIGSDLESLAKAPLLLEDFTNSAGEPCSFESRQPSLAMIHADGNGLGQMFIELARALSNEENSKAMECLKAFSRSFQEVGLTASEEAVESLRTTFQGPLPIQPIVLAGDDLTVITRGELAIPFAEAWLEAFEKATNEALSQLKNDFPVIQKSISVDFLTAGAGILFFNRSHPFIHAYSHVEHLASFTKTRAKHIATSNTAPSSIAFLKLSGGNQHITPLSHSKTHQLSAMPYYLGQLAAELPKLSQLRELRDALSSLPSGTTRRLLSEMRLHPESAESWLIRAIQILKEKPEGIDQVDRLETALRNLHYPHSDSNTPIPLWKTDGGANHLPYSSLPDAIHWASVEPQFPTTPSQPTQS